MPCCAGTEIWPHTLFSAMLDKLDLISENDQLSSLMKSIFNHKAAFDKFFSCTVWKRWAWQRSISHSISSISRKISNRIFFLDRNLVKSKYNEFFLIRAQNCNLKLLWQRKSVVSRLIGKDMYNMYRKSFLTTLSVRSYGKN